MSTLRTPGKAVPLPRAVRGTALWTVGPALATVVIGLWHLGTPSYWRDEAATLDAVTRPFPALLHMLTTVDAVHGGYYVVLWPVVHVFGTGEIVLRLPSVLAMAAAAAGISAIGRRLQSRATGLLAGLVFAVLPQVSRYAQEARSYALVLACAVLASWLLVRGGTEPRRGLTGYGWAVAALGTLNLFGLLLLAGHALYLLGTARSRLRAWAVPAALGCLPAVPIAILAWQQRDQLGWVAAPDASAGGDLVVWLAGSSGAAALMGVLVGLGLRFRGPAWLSLPWLIAPPVLLLLAARLAVPVYVPRYLAFCLPALALAIGAGLARTAWPHRVIALLLVAALGLPVQLAERGQDGHGEDIRAAAQALDQHARPGDGVLYHCPSCHYPDLPREFASAYPEAFGRLDDLALDRSPAASGTLRGTEVDPDTLARRVGAANRVWLVETGGDAVPRNVRYGRRVAFDERAGSLRLRLYSRQF
ncbi:glycosyltransferase family 39 protein [Amycolatopsis jiangsuensis]|uniref:Mannosyltransferase n=1 Tax=Amycolatopsis jiangsuensis TaxID=1181879 RepID=A0A840ITZ4_9PSEU|nr:glycosyltransferase family 39 protein [Amycolatopsis jiangsuensis]MBB4684925.1 mannosyltransferase [Amycolatopsis jiangsuensis]